MNVRPASLGEAILDFGATHIPVFYRPLLDSAAAKAQVDNWCTPERMSSAIDEGRVVVAEEHGGILGVAEWNLYEGEPPPSGSSTSTPHVGGKASVPF